MDDEVKQDNKRTTKEVVINTFSSLLFYFCMWLMTLVLPKLSSDGFTTAGIFTICLSIANIATAFSTYNISVYISSDSKKDFSDEHYFYFGLTTTIISLLVSIILCLVNGYNADIFWAVVLYYGFKMFDNFTLVLRSALQRVGKLLYFNYSLIVRSILSLGIFVLVMYFSKSLIITTASLMVFGFVYFVFVDLSITRRVCPTILHLSKSIYKKAASLFVLAFPVFIYGVSSAAIPSVPRLMFENIFNNEELLGYFGTMSSITVLIQAAVSSLVLPFIPKIATMYNNQENAKFFKLVLKLLIFVIGLTIVAFLMVFFLGDWALGIVYGEGILDYSSVFKWIVIATGLQSVLVLLSDVTVAIRKLKVLLISYIIGLVFMFGFMYLLISNYSMYGIIYVYYICYSIVSIMLFVNLFISMKNNKDTQNVSNQYQR